MTVALPGVAVAVGVAVLGPELLIAVSLLGAAGLLPFVDPTQTVLPDVKGYFFFFAIAASTMLATWGARVLAGRPSYPIRPNLLLAVLGANALYVLVALAVTDPLAEPTLAAPFAEFSVMAIVTYLWLSHEEAIEGMKRVLPVVVVIVAAWAVAYVAGAGGCNGCRTAVSSNLFNEGLLGPDSRLYTPGQNSLLALVLVAFGQALRRPTPLAVSLAALGLLSVALQASRAQYFGIAAGMVLLIAWRMRASRAGGKLVLATLAVAGFLALAASPVGERALTGYEDLRTGTGTPGYRLGLLERASDNWSPLGNGVTSGTLDLGVDYDLGLSNTLVVLGFAGGALQLALLALAVIWGLRAGTLAGATIAAIFAMVLVTRPSVPLMELGHSAVTYGVAIGFAAWLYVRPPPHRA
jgi:hypothetical protein